MNKIKEARLAAGLTQKKASELTGIPKRTIESWETEQRTPSEWLEKLVIKELNSLAEKNKT